MDTVIKDGTIFTATETYQADIGVDEDRQFNQELGGVRSDGPFKV